MQRTALITLLALFAITVQAATYNFITIDDERVTFYNTGSTTATRATRGVTGLLADEDIESIAWRPSNQQVYALGETGRLLTIDLSTLAVTLVGQTNCSINGGSGQPDFALSFNPVGDALRILGSDGSNRRVNPTTAACFVDSPIVYFDDNTRVAQPAGVAYTNQVSPAASTSEFFLDENNNALSSVFPFNAGNASIVAISNPVIDFDDQSPLSIVTNADGTNNAFSFINGRLYSVNLDTAAFTEVARYHDDDVDGFVVFPASFTIPAEQTSSTSTTAAATGATTTATSSASSLMKVGAVLFGAVALALAF